MNRDRTWPWRSRACRSRFRSGRRTCSAHRCGPIQGRAVYQGPRSCRDGRRPDDQPTHGPELTGPRGGPIPQEDERLGRVGEVRRRAAVTAIRRVPAAVSRVRARRRFRPRTRPCRAAAAASSAMSCFACSVAAGDTSPERSCSEASSRARRSSASPPTTTRSLDLLIRSAILPRDGASITCLSHTKPRVPPWSGGAPA